MSELHADEQDHNSLLVQEVVDFVSNGIFFNARAFDKNDFVLVTDFEKALETAWRQEMEDEDVLCWKDIRNIEASKVWEQYYKLPDSSQETTKMRRFNEDFFKILKKRLEGRYKEALDDISSDLANCAFSRAVMGKSNQFFEKLFEAYKSGFFPCGWSGKYPEGKMIIYSGEISR